jgi:hypothetical protein
LGSPPGAKARDGGPAALVGMEDLGEKNPQGDEGAKEPIAEANLFVAQGLLNGVGIEELRKG